MAFFEEEQLAGMRIDRMVFHLVGPRPSDFVRLEAMDPGRFAAFFIDRIRSVNSGAEYLFSDASATRERLHRIAEDPSLFQEESEKLAEDFQHKHGGGTAAGAFLVFILSAGGSQFFALLKYDDETVLTYDVEEGDDGRKRVTLDALERTFVQNNNALQKSALIRLTDAGGDLTVFDRQNPQKVARYFEGFLDARRVHDDADLTEKLVQVIGTSRTWCRRRFNVVKATMPPSTWNEAGVSASTSLTRAPDQARVRANRALSGGSAAMMASARARSAALRYLRPPSAA